MDKMNFSAKAVVTVSIACIVLIMSSLIMSACNTRMPRQQAQQNTQASVGTSQNGDNNVGSAQNQATTVISTEDAKAIALSHSGVSTENAKRYRSQLDRDDGRMVYEIEFDAGSYEYDYEIDAKTGEIVKFDKEHR